MATLRKAVEQYNRGEYFACHETLEDLWLGEPGKKRQFLQAFLHIAVSLYHFEQGNLRGSLSQTEKALAKIEDYRDDPYAMGIDRLILWLVGFQKRLVSALQSSVRSIQWKNPPLLDLPGANPWES